MLTTVVAFMNACFMIGRVGSLILEEGTRLEEVLSLCLLVLQFTLPVISIVTLVRTSHKRT